MISTLEALFSGEKALFEGLAIAKTDYDFAAYPVITIEFAKEEFATADNLRRFITGVSKFAKISVFSGMNSLTDISMDRRYATLCGVTQQELEDNFAEGIDALVALEGGADEPQKAQILAKIKHWYNGYYFEEHATSVYNPYSLLSLFSQQKFRNYWFDTATPTFLIDLIKAQQFNLAEIQDFELDDSAFMATEPEQISPLPVLLQTGYLTIASYDDGWYRLGFPNYEVEYAFNRAIVEKFSHTVRG